jgi:HNH endonuclease
MFGALNNELVGSHTRNEWLKVLEDQGHRCIWCGRSITDPDEAREAGIKLKREEKATPHHLVPKSRKGVDFIWNIVAACIPCNEVIHNRLPGEFLKDRPAFAHNVDNGKRLYIKVPLVKGRDGSGQIHTVSHLQISDFEAQALRHLKAKMPTVPKPPSPVDYNERRRTLQKQLAEIEKKRA